MSRQRTSDIGRNACLRMVDHRHPQLVVYNPAVGSDIGFPVKRLNLITTWRIAAHVVNDHRCIHHVRSQHYHPSPRRNWWRQEAARLAEFLRGQLLSCSCHITLPCPKVSPSRENLSLSRLWHNRKIAEGTVEQAMEQATFAELEHDSKKRRTRRELFLEKKGRAGSVGGSRSPGGAFYPKPGRGRRPYPLRTMLRVHCVQLWYDLSDPGMRICSTRWSRCAGSRAPAVGPAAGRDDDPEVPAPCGGARSRRATVRGDQRAPGGRGP